MQLESWSGGDCSARPVLGADQPGRPRCTPAAPDTARDKEQQQQAWGRARQKQQKLENAKREPVRKLSNTPNLKAAHVKNVKSIHKY